jgi:hypothetical protein
VNEEMVRRRFNSDGFYEDERPSDFWDRVERESFTPAQIEENEKARQAYLDRIEVQSTLSDGTPAPGSWAWREKLLRNA